ncbi:hypothetical protein CXF68_20055 [Tenacibaculum sp. Bg11-29]|nr:hypothetical protein CXF68_20055 [Tenacibaculum sp. Bg11-29]
MIILFVILGLIIIFAGGSGIIFFNDSNSYNDFFDSLDIPIKDGKFLRIFGIIFIIGWTISFIYILYGMFF